jgi:hypothetical protein
MGAYARGQDGRRMWHAWEKKRNLYKIFVGNPEEKKHLKDVGVDGRIILNWILK